VFIASDDSGLYIYRNKGDFQLEFDQFIETDADATLNRIFCSDIDNNGFIDIALIKGYYGATPSKLQLLFNNEEGEFQDTPVKIKEVVANQNSLVCYPNPFSDRLNIDIKSMKHKEIEINILDINGRQIKSKKLSDQYRYSWNGTDKNEKEVKNSLYFIMLKVGNRIEQYKVIKIK
jgi:hypothetical protein